jgi:branched-chain amino acid transport system substrate-binding protein
VTGMFRIDRRVAWVGLVLGLAVVVGCGGDDDGSASADGGKASGDPYLVASTQDLTGPVASLGKPSADGFKTCVQKVNDDGGINGRPMEFQAMDDAHNPDRALTNYKQLIAKKPVAFQNHVGSAVMIPVTAELEKAKVPGIGVNPVADLVDNPYYYSVGISTISSYNVSANYIAQEIGGTPSVGVIGLESPAGIAEAKQVAGEMTDAGWTATTQSVALDATDASSQAQKIANADPDAVILGLVATHVPFTFKSLKGAGVDVPVINFAPTADDGVLKAVNDPNFMVVRDFVTPNNSESSSAKEIRDAAAKAGTDSEANMGAIAFTKGWVGCQIVAEGLRQCGDDCTGEKLNAAMEGLSTFDVGDLSDQALTFGSGDHQGAEDARVVKWNSAENKAEPASDYFPVEFEGGGN